MTKLQQNVFQDFQEISDSDLVTISGNGSWFDARCTFGSVGAAATGGLAFGPLGVLAGGATGMATFCK
ncbi:hypothetical protein [Leuconostoc citreum]|uniref:hypothetical protein n=1 Tax=Leuconostoc citreum TaxID=33964 RepID=UPI000BFF0E56|nr:hypothetical protein [Leuconostoc citreum]